MAFCRWLASGKNFRILYAETITRISCALRSPLGAGVKGSRVRLDCGPDRRASTRATPNFRLPFLWTITRQRLFLRCGARIPQA
jgi:hypothetical protein